MSSLRRKPGSRPPGAQRGAEEPSADGRTPEDEPERKERVLHTRVPESLDRQLRRRARSLGMTVSTVVRHVLLNTFGLVDDIVTDSTNVALSIAGADAIDEEGHAARGTPRSRNGGGDPSGAAEVVAWQEAILNRNAVCERCNDLLPRGVRAAVGVGERPGPRAFLCLACLHASTGHGATSSSEGGSRGRRTKGRPRRRKV